LRHLVDGCEVAVTGPPGDAQLAGDPALTPSKTAVELRAGVVSVEDPDVAVGLQDAGENRLEPALGSRVRAMALATGAAPTAMPAAAAATIPQRLPTPGPPMRPIITDRGQVSSARTGFGRARH